MSPRRSVCLPGFFRGGPARASLLFLLLLPAGSVPLPAGEAASTAAPSGPPLVRLEVTGEREELESFAPLLEGRLVSRLGTETGLALLREEPAAGAPAWRCRLVVTDLSYDIQTERSRSKEADSAGSAVQTDQVLLGRLEVTVSLFAPGAASPRSDDTIAVGARRTVADAVDVGIQRGGVLDDLLERATEKIVRLLKKSLRR